VAHVKAMLDAYPKDLGNVDRERLAGCIEACFECAQACTVCADACLGEEMVAELVTCIRTDLDCADLCTVTGAILSRQTGYNSNVTKAVLEACRVACNTCATDCESHADMHDHCRLCGEACRRCETACVELLASLS
jgi:hypothetical protein